MGKAKKNVITDKEIEETIDYYYGMSKSAKRTFSILGLVLIVIGLMCLVLLSSGEGTKMSVGIIGAIFFCIMGVLSFGY